jgi:nucleoside-diphosphate-sugar epimerase
LTSVLVVGGRGSVGKSIVRQLQSLNVPLIKTYDLAKVVTPVEEQVGQSHMVHLQGDVRDPRAASEAVKGVQTVIWAVMPDLLKAPVRLYDEINVKGVENLVTAAEQSASTERFVYTSSTAVTGITRPSIDEDESFPLPKLTDYILHYERTKRLGEDFVLEANKRGNLLTCSLRPSAILSDDPEQGLTRMGYLDSKVFPIPSKATPYDYITTQDLARALTVAGEHMSGQAGDKVSGEAFFTTGLKTSSQETIKHFAKISGKKTFIMSPAFEQLIRSGLYIQHKLTEQFAPEKALGYPMHQLMATGDVQKTFKNLKFMEATGFVPQVTIEQGLQNLLDNEKARSLKIKR